MLSIVHSGQVALGRAGLDILGSPHNWHISVNIVNIWRLYFLALQTSTNIYKTFLKIVMKSSKSFVL